MIEGNATAAGADERAQVAAEAAQERAAENPPPPKAEGPSAAPGAEQAAPSQDLDLKAVARLAVEGIDIGARWLGGPHVTADEKEKEFLSTYTAPVLAKWLPSSMQALSPEQALLAAVLIVYGSKVAMGMMAAPSSPPPAEKPAEKEVKGEATVTPAGPPA